MISEGSCDTEDLSNGYRKFFFFSAIAGINYILKYKLNYNNISQYYCLEQWFMCQAFYMKYGDHDKKKNIYIWRMISPVLW